MYSLSPAELIIEYTLDWFGFNNESLNGTESYTQRATLHFTSSEAGWLTSKDTAYEDFTLY